MVPASVAKLVSLATAADAVGWNYQLRRLRGGFDVGYYDRSSTVPDVDESKGIRFVVHLSFTP